MYTSFFVLWICIVDFLSISTDMPSRYISNLAGSSIQNTETETNQIFDWNLTEPDEDQAHTQNIHMRSFGSVEDR